VWSAAWLVGLAVLYLLLVRTHAGQHLDEVATQGRQATLLAPRRFGARVVELVTPLALGLGGVALVLGAARWRGRRSAVAVVGALAVTVVAARLLKAGLWRDELLDTSRARPENTFPSGHSAAAVVLVLLAVTICPPWWRGRVAATCVGVVTVHTLFMAGSGWHRLADVAGALALGAAAASLAACVIVGEWRGEASPAGPEWFGATRGLLAAAGGAVGAAVLWYLPLRLLSPDGVVRLGFAAHVAVTLVLCVASALCVAVHARLVQAADVAAVPAGVTVRQVAPGPSGS
jgi:hypothetical protein